jgi:hypothetical protein
MTYPVAWKVPSGSGDIDLNFASQAQYHNKRQRVLRDLQRELGADLDIVFYNDNLGLWRHPGRNYWPFGKYYGGNGSIPWICPLDRVDRLDRLRSGAQAQGATQAT